MNWVTWSTTDHYAAIGETMNDTFEGYSTGLICRIFVALRSITKISGPISDPSGTHRHM